MKAKWKWLLFVLAGLSLLGILAAMMIPSFIVPPRPWHGEAYERNCCINNLRMIEAAKDAYAMEHNCSKGWSWSNDVIAFRELYGETNGAKKKREGPYYIKKYLRCPSSTNTILSAEQAASEYAVNPIWSNAICKVRHGHKLR